jgi:hypothetical protein
MGMALFSKSKPVGARGVNALLGNMVDRRRDSLYDRVRLKAGEFFPSLVICFQVPVGCCDEFDSSHVKTFADTNMFSGGQLSPPYDMIVKRFLFLFQPSTSEVDRNAVLANYTWEFRQLQKIMARTPVLVCAATGKPEDLIENFGKPGFSREECPISNIDKLGDGICWDLGPDGLKYIPPLVSFAVVLQGQSFKLQADIDFYVILDGLRDWPIQ